MIGFKFFNILKLTYNLVQLVSASLIYRHDLNTRSLIYFHDFHNPSNSLIYSHELYRSNQPLLATVLAAITIVSKYFKPNPLNIMSCMFRMNTRSQAVKRPRPSSVSTSTSRSLTTYHHSSTSRTGVARTSRADGSRAHESRGQVPAPHINPTVVSSWDKERLAADVKERKNEAKYRDSVCSMCSDSNHAVRHHHFSSSMIRMMFISPRAGQEKQTYMCPICKEPEPVRIPAGQTRRLLLCDSTLYGVWDKPKPEGLIHFDIDCIVGGKIRDLIWALGRNFLHMPNRLQIVVVGGINNIGAGEKAGDIMAEMLELKQVVKSHSEKWAHSPPSSVVFCTLPFPPKFCSMHLPVNPPEKEIREWIPPATFRNKFEEVKDINDQIVQLHRKEGLQLVRLDYQGVKWFKSGTKQHKFDNKPGATPIWHETEVFRKLHFTMENKLKIIGHISKCFQSNASM